MSCVTSRGLITHRQGRDGMGLAFIDVLGAPGLEGAVDRADVDLHLLGLASQHLRPVAAPPGAALGPTARPKELEPGDLGVEAAGEHAPNDSGVRRVLGGRVHGALVGPEQALLPELLDQLLPHALDHVHRRDGQVVAVAVEPLLAVGPGGLEALVGGGGGQLVRHASELLSQPVFDLGRCPSP